MLEPPHRPRTRKPFQSLYDAEHHFIRGWVANVCGHIKWASDKEHECLSDPESIPNLVEANLVEGKTSVVPWLGVVARKQTVAPDDVAASAKGLPTLQKAFLSLPLNLKSLNATICKNRVAQRPRQIEVQIFKTESRGWGTRLSRRINSPAAERLIVSTPTSTRHQTKTLQKKAYSVDAFGCGSLGNWTRFMNHSCSPNTQIISVVYDATPQDNMPYLAFVATEDIPAHTELTFDYNPAHQTEWESKRLREKSRSKKNMGKNHTRCLCRTSNCRGWLSVVA
ncbi:hypothetical protein B0H14DRAFT_2585404 [Mycena olivaceomarginata]|nr:hypothetical protein B0H14DRAFT_2585404 [Mycena olivaceomarginata]